MHRVRCLVVLGFLVLTSFAAVRAWDVQAHTLISRVALERLNPKAKAEVARLAAEVPHAGDPYNSVTISLWMDEIRMDSRMADFGKFKSWHYIDIPIDDRDPMPSFEPGGDNEEHGNVVQALKRAVVVLKGGTDPYIESKAMACAMVMHLVGDIHQPLHCATKYFFSHGQWRDDMGGNEELVANMPSLTPGSLPFRLHYFWDAAYRARFDAAGGNIDLASICPREDLPAASDDKSLEPDFDAWAKDSNAIARNFVYRNLTATDDKKTCRLSSEYVAQAREIARAQLVLAGLRLAALLNATLGADDPGPPPPSYPAGPPSHN